MNRNHLKSIKIGCMRLLFLCSQKSSIFASDAVIQPIFTNLVMGKMIRWVYGRKDYLKRKQYDCHSKNMDILCYCVAASTDCDYGDGTRETCHKYRVCGSSSTGWCAMIMNKIGDHEK